MPVSTAVLAAALLVAAAVPAGRPVQTANPDPFWVDPTPAEHAEQLSRYEPFRASVRMGVRETPDMAVIIEEGLTDSVGPALLQRWLDDIRSEEYTAQLIEVSYGEPEEIKGLLDSLYQDGLEGAVLVGDLPAAWIAVWDTQLNIGEQLPCDYFMMDLDGDWLDLWVGYPRDSVPGQDGFYDTFEGTVDPEIWVGRIRVDNLTGAGDPVHLLRNYLERNHLWRTGALRDSSRALCYVDDDWAANAVLYASYMEMLYEDVEMVSEHDSTTSQDYEEERLTSDYVWVSPFVHSNPSTHFWAPSAGTTTWDEVLAIAPAARFYNLFACSNARFTTGNCMGGIYSIGAPHGLAAVGSTCSGAMLRFGSFYGPLGGGGSLGEAWEVWWADIAGAGFTAHELNWFIGMTLLGDPSLVPSMYLTGIGERTPGMSPSLAVGPNPCGGTATAVVDLPEGSSGTLSVYDLSGRLLETSAVASGRSRLTVDLTGTATGTVLLRLVHGGGTLTGRLVILD